MTTTIYVAVGVMVTATPELQAGGTKNAACVDINLAPPSNHLTGYVLRLPYAVAHKLWSDFGEFANSKLDTITIAGQHTKITRINRDGDGLFRFEINNAIVFVRGLFVSEMITAVGKVVVK